MTWETYYQLIWAWILLGLVTFVYLLYKKAPFGRHTRPGWGPTLPNAWGWVIMEFSLIPSFLLPIWQSDRPIPPIICFMVSLFMIHYLHRSLVYPAFLHTRGKRMPVVIVLSAITFNAVNGTFFGTWFGTFADYDASWWQDSRFLFGLLLFLVGAAINVRSDYRLIALRKGSETGYTIPHGGLFRWVSCPNHFGEMLEWTGYALLTWSLPGLAFAFWTIANVLPRSLAHHAWYQEHFPDYPAGRKAVFPGVL
ncbi:MAG: DUF1295 domain-containing protein [Saprospiraceae bacterium]